MTILGWICFVVVAGLIGLYTWALATGSTTKKERAIKMTIGISLIIAVLLGMLAYFNLTASGRRKKVDQRSEIGNGLERTITVYTADGNVIAQYSGKIDIEDNAGGYVLFDYNGKRYTYYNCFVESIAEIGG